MRLKVKMQCQIVELPGIQSVRYPPRENQSTTGIKALSRHWNAYAIGIQCPAMQISNFKPKESYKLKLIQNLYFYLENSSHINLQVDL